MFDEPATSLSKKRKCVSSSTLSFEDSEDSAGSFNDSEDINSFSGCKNSVSSEDSEDISSTIDSKNAVDFTSHESNEESTMGSEDSEDSMELASTEKKSNGVARFEEIITMKKMELKTVPELKKILKDRGLRVSGSKAELVQRITGIDSPTGNQFEKTSVSKPKKKKLDLDDPFLKECFICSNESEVPYENKLKDARICNGCKNDPKKKKFTMEESRNIFNLPKPILRGLSCKRGHNRRNFYYLFAINSLARACVQKYGSLKESRE